MLISSLLTSCLSTWHQELTHDMDREFLLQGFTNGFHIIQSESPLQHTECNNYKSATHPNVKPLVEQEILCELSLGRYIASNIPMTITSSLGAVPRKDKVKPRLIHDCSMPHGKGLNSYAKPDHFSFETIDTAIKHISHGSYCAKIDLASAYRHVPLHPSNFHATGLKWHFHGNSTPTYMYDTRLPFGASASVGHFHRITQSVARIMHRRGFPSVICYIDDFLIIEKTKERAQEAYDTLIKLLQSLGFTISWDKLVPPSQNITFLGIEIDTVKHTLFLPPRKTFRATKVFCELAWQAKCYKTGIAKLL